MLCQEKKFTLIKINLVVQWVTCIYRGSDQLIHQAFKGFGFEQLPFKRFVANAALYFCMRYVLLPDSDPVTYSYNESTFLDTIYFYLSQIEEFLYS
jgi:hypothetical protein